MKRNDSSNGSSELQSSSTVVALRKKVKTLQQKLRRRKMKIHSTNDLFDHLRTSKCTTDDLQIILKNNFSGLPFELKQEIDNMPYVRNCALMFDSMSIRKQISYNANLDRKMGYVDLGGIANADSIGLATEALVFMIVSLNGNFKCPTAYFFINKMIAILQAQITSVFGKVE